MLWILIALLNPLLHSWSNIIDNVLVNRIFKNPLNLVVFSAAMNIVFLPLLFLFQIPVLPTLNTLPIFILLGLLDIAYVYPYYKALQHDDTSVVSGLFSLGKVFVPLFAFIIVGEVLSINQYLGFILIILSSSLMTLNFKKLKMGKSFIYMVAVSVILSMEAVLYKFALAGLDWVTVITWSSVFTSLFAFALFVVKRKEILLQLPKFKKKVHLFVLEEIITFGGSVAGIFAMSIAPVTLVVGVWSLQPIFILAYALLFSRMMPNVFKEKVDRKSVLKKVLLFGLVIIGGILAFYE